MTGTACTDDARVKVPSFQKVTFLLQYEIIHRDANHLFFVCMKMFLTAVIQDEHASDDSLQSDSSFLLRNSMMTDTTSSWFIEIQLFASNLHRQFALFCTPYYLRYGIEIFQRLCITTRRHCSSFEIEKIMQSTVKLTL